MKSFLTDASPEEIKQVVEKSGLTPEQAEAAIITQKLGMDKTPPKRESNVKPEFKYIKEYNPNMITLEFGDIPTFKKSVKSAEEFYIELLKNIIEASKVSKGFGFEDFTTVIATCGVDMYFLLKPLFGTRCRLSSRLNTSTVELTINRQNPQRF